MADVDVLYHMPDEADVPDSWDEPQPQPKPKPKPAQRASAAPTSTVKIDNLTVTVCEGSVDEAINALRGITAVFTASPSEYRRTSDLFINGRSGKPDVSQLGKCWINQHMGLLSALVRDFYTPVKARLSIRKIPHASFKMYDDLSTLGFYNIGDIIGSAGAGIFSKKNPRGFGSNPPNWKMTVFVPSMCSLMMGDREVISAGGMVQIEGNAQSAGSRTQIRVVNRDGRVLPAPVFFSYGVHPVFRGADKVYVWYDASDPFLTAKHM